MPDFEHQTDDAAFPRGSLDSDVSASDAGLPVADDHDSPWKDALELYFPQALALLAPDLHAAIDWSVAPVFLDKELQAIAIPGKKGRRLVDKLVRVRLRDGADAWLLIHVEVERRLDGDKALKVFAWRMYEYRYRIQARIMQQRGLDLPPRIYSLGILLESHGVGNRLVHVDEYQGQGVRFTFPVVELESWRTHWDELDRLAPTNPFAVVMMAQLQANRYSDKRTRLKPKLDLVRRLRHYGYDPAVAGAVYRLIEWMIALPQDLEPEYLQAVSALSEERKMTYVTLIERAALAKGHAQGHVEGLAEGHAEGSVEGQSRQLLRQIQRRFGPLSDEVTQRILSAKASQLETWSLNILDATELDDVFRD